MRLGILKDIRVKICKSETALATLSGLAECRSNKPSTNLHSPRPIHCIILLVRGPDFRNVGEDTGRVGNQTGYWACFSGISPEHTFNQPISMGGPQESMNQGFPPDA